MKLVRCKNGFMDKKNGECGHIVGMMTDAQVAALKTDPEGGIIFRCPGCSAEQRWFKIIDEGNGPVFQSIPKPKELPDDLIYIDERKFNQVG